MSPINPESVGLGQQSATFADYETLLPAESVPRLVETEPIPLETYAQTAQQIVSSREYFQRQRVNPSEELASLREIYVEDVADERLRRFAVALIDAPIQAQRDATLTKLRQELAANPHDEDKLAKMRELKYRACEYNHVVRDTILQGRRQFDRPTPTSWMTGATSSRYPRWARDTIAGASAEVALYDALNTMPEMADVAFASTEKDLRGIDIEAQSDGRPIGFDVKFGEKETRRSVRGSGHNQMTHATISDLSLSNWGHQHLVEKIRNAVR